MKIELYVIRSHTTKNGHSFRRIDTIHHTVDHYTYDKVYKSLYDYLKVNIIEGVNNNKRYIITNKNPSEKKQYLIKFDKVYDIKPMEKIIVDNILYEISQILNLYCVISDFTYVANSNNCVSGIMFKAFEKDYIFDLADQDQFKEIYTV